MDQTIQHQLKVFGYKRRKLNNILSNYFNVTKRKDIQADDLKSDLSQATIDYVLNELKINTTSTKNIDESSESEDPCSAAKASFSAQ